MTSRRDEDRMVRLLAGEGLLRRSRWPVAGRGVLIAIASLALFGGGWATATLGTAFTPAPEAEDATYVMLLYPSGAFRPGTTRAKEYAAWARAAHGEGRVLDGQELGETVAVLGEPAPGDPNGLFVIQARTEAAAVRLARTTPHLRHGGAVVVRAVP